MHKLGVFLSDHYFAKVLRVLAESFSRSLVKNLYEDSAQFLLLCKDGNLKAAETKCNYSKPSLKIGTAKRHLLELSWPI